MITTGVVFTNKIKYHLQTHQVVLTQLEVKSCVARELQYYDLLTKRSLVVQFPATGNINLYGLCQSD